MHRTLLREIVRRVEILRMAMLLTVRLAEIPPTATRRMVTPREVVLPTIGLLPVRREAARMAVVEALTAVARNHREDRTVGAPRQEADTLLTVLLHTARRRVAEDLTVLEDPKDIRDATEAILFNWPPPPRGGFFTGQ